MICNNGTQMQFEGETGLYFICEGGKYDQNQCRYSRWCGIQRHYVMIDDPPPCKQYIGVTLDEYLKNRGA